MKLSLKRSVILFKNLKNFAPFYIKGKLNKSCMSVLFQQPIFLNVNKKTSTFINKRPTTSAAQPDSISTTPNASRTSTKPSPSIRTYSRRSWPEPASTA